MNRLVRELRKNPFPGFATSIKIASLYCQRCGVVCRLSVFVHTFSLHRLQMCLTILTKTKIKGGAGKKEEDRINLEKKANPHRPVQRTLVYYTRFISTHRMEPCPTLRSDVNTRDSKRGSIDVGMRHSEKRLYVRHILRMPCSVQFSRFFFDFSLSLFFSSVHLNYGMKKGGR